MGAPGLGLGRKSPALGSVCPLGSGRELQGCWAALPGPGSESQWRLKAPETQAPLQAAAALIRLGSQPPQYPAAWQRHQGSGHQEGLDLAGPVTVQPQPSSPCTKDIFLYLGRQALAVRTDGHVVICKKQPSPAAPLAPSPPSTRAAASGAWAVPWHSRSVRRAAVSISRHLLRTASQVTGTGGNVVILGVDSILGSSGLLRLERDRPAWAM